MNQYSNVWTKERDDTLIVMWARGDSATKIGKAIGMGRNAVVGRIFRLRSKGVNLEQRNRSGGKRKRRLINADNSMLLKIRRRRDYVQPHNLTNKKLSRKGDPGQSFLPKEPEIESRRISLYELTSKTCRWPIGHPGEAGFAFCGNECEGTYCEAHHAVAFIPKAKIKGGWRKMAWR